MPSERRATPGYPDCRAKKYPPIIEPFETVKVLDSTSASDRGRGVVCEAGNFAGDRPVHASVDEGAIVRERKIK
jgi:hypothetical protein